MTETEFEEVALLLPFYVNGSLGDADIARVDTALAQSPELREELADIQALSSLVSAGGQQWEAERVPAGEDRLGRLMDRIAAEPRKTAQTVTAPAEKQHVITAEHRKPGFFASLFQPAWKPAFAAMALVAMAQGVMLYDGLGSPDNNNGEFQTASGPDNASQAVSDFRVLLRIAPSAPWADVESLLADYELTIINGPSDGVVEVAAGTDLTVAEQKALMNSLKSSSAISDVLTAG